MVGKAKVEVKWSRHSADGRATFKVTDIPESREHIATVDFIGNEIAYKYFSYQFPDIRSKARSYLDACEWVNGAHELYDQLNELALIDDMIDWGDKLFEG